MKLHHVGLVVDDIASKAELYQKSLGIGLTTGVTADPTQQVRVAFAEDENGVAIEFIEPSGPESPVSRFLERGGGWHHVCYQVEDLEAAVEGVRQAGGMIVQRPVSATAFDGRRIAFVLTLDGSLVEFLEGGHGSGGE